MFQVTDPLKAIMAVENYAVATSQIAHRVWSARLPVAPLGGIGIMFASYDRWRQKVGWHGAEASLTTLSGSGIAAV
ncbi:hypothetical protein MB901379_01337 [Mycobacterium basiliense]|uniref:Uncharacterized protein n=1 Tax=Mycobacterium basiliense TaxID=2094119 RepID=A0A447GBE4_9MYCO|nr:hypothetical protein MB901379_01337 [Mycobacterium basiliense]